MCMSCGRYRKVLETMSRQTEVVTCNENALARLLNTCVIIMLREKHSRDTLKLFPQPNESQLRAWVSIILSFYQYAMSLFEDEHILFRRTKTTLN